MKRKEIQKVDKWEKISLKKFRQHFKQKTEANVRDFSQGDRATQSSFLSFL